jgi:hypothetical protein
MQHVIAQAATAEEATAIASAIEALWPKAMPVAPRENPNTSWRFSGRWWSDTSVTRRTRPGF